VAGLDVAYARGSDRLAAAVVVLDAVTLDVVEEVAITGAATFPYIPGLFAFRETVPQRPEGRTLKPCALKPLRS
jgi:deoxyribonuclease V